MAKLSGLHKLRDWELTEARQMLASLLGEQNDLVMKRQILEGRIQAELAALPNMEHPHDVARFLAASRAEIDRLSASIQEMESAISRQQDQVAERYKDLKTIEMMQARAEAEAANKARAVEQASLDEVALRRR